MTPILQVITEYCSVYVKDINLEELAATNMPLYARRMWGYLRPAISLFTSPPDMQIYLLGTTENPTLTEPIVASNQYVFSEEATTDTTISLGDDFKNFELFSCQIRSEDDFGNIILSPTSVATYNATDGTVTFAASADVPIPRGTVFDMDFYTDGQFAKTLSREMMNILGFCFQCVWLERFTTDWLSLVTKIEDRSFTEQNRANKERADTEKLQAARTKLAEEMRKFEQSLAFREKFPTGSGLL